MTERRNVFILGLNDFLRGELASVRNADAYAFHDLVGVDEVLRPDEHSFNELLDAARAELDAFDGSIDAIISHWDFPSSLLAPVLAHEHGLPAPSLESLLKCEHKYWSRLEQEASIPDSIPDFSAFDPFADDPRSQIDLDYPFWVKPVKGHSSQLGFQIEDRADFDDAIARIRDEIEDLADAFDEVLEMADLPPEIRDAPGTTCLVEQIMKGIQAAPEGSVFHGRFDVHGFFDMQKDERNDSIVALDYPASAIPPSVQDRMVDAARRFLEHIGFDNGCFNVEYLWDPDNDNVCVVEVNTRISQSHSDLFAKVDGRTNHEIAIDVAIGDEPRLPDQAGEFTVASKCILLEPDDGVVRRVPDDDDLEELRGRFPGIEVRLGVQPGDRLADLPHQDAYNYGLGHVYIGAGGRDELERRRQEALRQLRSYIVIEPVEGDRGVAERTTA